MKKTVSIIGGGPAALALAAFLDESKFEVKIYEKQKSLGRKFLVAGKGGFNLTHSESIDQMIGRYEPSNLLEASLRTFDNVRFRQWLDKIGIKTYIGSSKRVFPIKGIKPIEVLDAIKLQLKCKNVKFFFGKTWTGWSSEQELLFADAEKIKSDYNVFALGGGSWKVTGSDGRWLQTFRDKGIQCIDFQSSNCGFYVDWKEDFISKFEGSFLKNISISTLNKIQKGELIITKKGLEGSAIYALSSALRTQLNKSKTAMLSVDFKPKLEPSKLMKKLLDNSEKNTSGLLKNKIKLSPNIISLIKTHLTKEEFLNKTILAKCIKEFPLKIVGLAPIDESISTVGGISSNAVGEHFKLNKIKNTYCIGEMLDWDAPTGGYLLQACFSMGFYLADHLNCANKSNKEQGSTP